MIDGLEELNEFTWNKISLSRAGSTYKAVFLGTEAKAELEFQVEGDDFWGTVCRSLREQFHCQVEYTTGGDPPKVVFDIKGANMPSDQPCDNCHVFFDGKPIWATIKEGTVGLDWDKLKQGIRNHTRTGTIDVPRIFCSEKCEQEHRQKWEVKPKRAMKVWSDEELCKFFKITLADLDFWESQGCKVNRLNDGSRQWTEEAIDDYNGLKREGRTYLMPEAE
jgi:hypothetical protein